MLREDSLILQNKRLWRCAKCLRTLPDSDFHLRTAAELGHSSWCKACTNKTERERQRRRVEERKTTGNNPTGLHRCASCREVKDASEFPRDASTARGIKSSCKVCVNARNADYKAKRMRP